jgi:hypothetical protein
VENDLEAFGMIEPYELVVRRIMHKKKTFVLKKNCLIIKLSQTVVKVNANFDTALIVHQKRILSSIHFLP